MFSTKSLQFALTKRLTVMVGVFWIAGSLLADFTMYHEMQEVFDSSLVKSAYRYAPCPRQDNEEAKATKATPNEPILRLVEAF